MDRNIESVVTSLGAGLVGALGVTLLNESIRRIAPRSRHVPRMDAIGENALAKTMEMFGGSPPRDPADLYAPAMAADLVSNGLFYALVGRGGGAYLRGALLGSMAGAGAALLPPMMGLTDERDDKSSRANQFATFGYYLTGGLLAAAASNVIGRSLRRRARHA